MKAIERITAEALKAAGYRERECIANAVKVTSRRDGFRGSLLIIRWQTADGCSCEYCVNRHCFTN